MDGNNINYVSPDELDCDPHAGDELESYLFLVATLYREDIDHILEREKLYLQSEALTSEVMRKICEKLNADYLEQLFWSSLSAAVHAVVPPEEFKPLAETRDDLPYEEYYDGG